MKIKQSQLWMNSFLKTWILKSSPFIVISFKFNLTKLIKKISQEECFINPYLCSNKCLSTFMKPKNHRMIQIPVNKCKSNPLYLKMISVVPILILTKRT